MGLNLVFEQRTIGPKKTSVRSIVQLRTPSGPQETESSLETDLVIQLNFSTRVVDLITQPILNLQIDDKHVRYTPDVLVELFPDGFDSPRYYMIEAKRKEDLVKKFHKYAPKFNAARDWCAANHAEFRVVSEEHIRTAYWHNAKLLGEHLGKGPENDAISILWNLLRKKSYNVTDALGYLRTRNIDEPEGRHAIEIAVANRLIGSDLSARFTDETILFELPEGARQSNDTDPILKIIRNAQFP